MKDHLKSKHINIAAKSPIDRLVYTFHTTTRYIVGFLNTGMGGTLYAGILDK